MASVDMSNRDREVRGWSQKGREREDGGTTVAEQGVTKKQGEREG